MNLRQGVAKGLALLAMLVVAPAGLALERLEAEYVRPSVDFSQYTQVMIHPLHLDRTKVIPPAWAEDKSPGKWALEAESVKFVQDLFLSTLKAQVEQDARFKVVPFTGPGIMEIEVRIVSLTPFAARNEKVMTKGTGEIQVRAEFTDGASGTLLGVLSGVQTVGSDYQPNSIDTNKANTEALFKAWGKRLLDHLRAAQR